jgi:retron-type reverse transcriptase
MREPKLKGKSYDIPKRLVWDAWLKVKENGGAAGPDGVTIEQFGEDLSRNLYRLWNRMSSGSYFPGPVRAVEIPKKGKKGGIRVLGIPTVTSYPKVVQAAFGFAGCYSSVSSAARGAPCGAVRPPCWRQSHLCL